MAPSPPGIRITLARGAFGLISTAREPPMLTVSSATAGAQANAASIAASPKQAIRKRFFILLFPIHFPDPKRVRSSASPQHRYRYTTDDPKQVCVKYFSDGQGRRYPIKAI